MEGVEYWALTRGWTYTESNLYVSDRRRRKKEDIILPLIILFKLFKVKVLVAIAVAILLFLKKAVLVAAIILPSIWHSIKVCKTHHHHPHHHGEYIEEIDAGNYGYYGDKGFERAYNYYRPK